MSLWNRILGRRPAEPALPVIVIPQAEKPAIDTNPSAKPAGNEGGDHEVASKQGAGEKPAKAPAPTPAKRGAKPSLALRGPDPKVAERRQKISALRDKGKMPKEISEILGVALSTVNNDLFLAKRSNQSKSPSNRDVSAGGEASPEAGPQAEASHAGTGSGKLADREGHNREGEGAGPIAGDVNADVRPSPDAAEVNWPSRIKLNFAAVTLLEQMARETGKAPEDIAAGIIADVLRDDAECEGAPALEPTDAPDLLSGLSATARRAIEAAAELRQTDVSDLARQILEGAADGMINAILDDGAGA